MILCCTLAVSYQNVQCVVNNFEVNIEVAEFDP